MAKSTFYLCKATVLTLGKGTLMTKCCPKRSSKQSSSMASNLLLHYSILYFSTMKTLASIFKSSTLEKS